MGKNYSHLRYEYDLVDHDSIKCITTVAVVVVVVLTLTM